MVDKQNKFVITTTTIPGDCNTADQCQFDIEIEIAVPIPRPPCPEININFFEVTSSFQNGVQDGVAGNCCLDKTNRFEITTTTIPGDCNTADRCIFDVELELCVSVPRTPCPVIDITTFKVFTGYDDEACMADKKNKFVITTTTIPGDCNTADQCQFDFDLEICVLIPRPSCPEININFFEVTSSFQNGVQDGITGNCCLDKTNRFEITTTTIPGDCNEPDRCIFDVELELCVSVPRTPCPVIDITNFGVFSGYDDEACMVDKNNKFVITTTTIPGDCNTADQCQFDVELEICVFIPRVPCPVIGITKFGVKTGYPGTDENCAHGENRFEITTRHVPGENCNDPGFCVFDVELAIDVEIPKPP